MLKEIKTERIPIKMWLSDIEEGALAQARNLANLPFAHNHIALMPDCHQGFGMPIGGVAALDNVIIPNAVGVDIGCGMCAVKTTLEHISYPVLKDIMTGIRELVPLGFKHHQSAQGSENMPQREVDPILNPIVTREYDKAQFQVGTLGGGNHFIEIQKDENNHIWIMIHSGSRNIGKQVADHYNRLATELNEKWKSPIPRSAQLAWLPFDSVEGQTYLREMQYCVDFAFANRKLMMKRITDVFEQHCKGKFNAFPMINIAHNYAAVESHYGKDLVVHRKGATLATDGTFGIIPGSQGTESFIVKGKGNPESFNSCSHGAGRVMGRKQAQRSLNLKEEIKKLNEKGIIHAIRTQKDLDEATSAYKNIDVVMNNQKDLVDIVHRLTPLAVVKG
ncbi:MAG: RtcB family protein [Bacteroidetes bacterium]|nr:MAG: RtcB family protein [Bacteroidota bacterium]